jgi:hypothetical protein
MSYHPEFRQISLFELWLLMIDWPGGCRLHPDKDAPPRTIHVFQPKPTDRPHLFVHGIHDMRLLLRAASIRYGRRFPMTEASNAESLD